VEIPNGRSTRSWWCSCSNEIFIEAGLLHGDCLTVTGKTLAENLAIVPDLNDGQVIHEIQKSIKSHRKYSNFIR
jgi:dihydroxyacid dehydratase/phosphogluconate dehydratase